MTASFKELEQAGWTAKAGAYDAHFAAITRQAIGPVLDTLSEIAGHRVLDVCCGTGDLAAAALARGASVIGIDFAATMVEIARRKVRGASFACGDAEALPFSDGAFDAAVCAFGIWHLAEPDRAMFEAARVLRPGGTYTFTTWLPPQQGWDMFDLLIAAVQAHGSMDVDLPPAPPPFRFADASEARRTLAACGFDDVDVRTGTALWTGTSGEQVLDVIYKAIVRAPMLIEAQPLRAREPIRNDIRNGAERLRRDGKIVMRWPYLMASARRAKGHP